MDPVLARSFIKELIYDLNTVRYLFDYHRIKETLPIIRKILDDIGSFREGNPGMGIFSEEYWKGKLSGGLSFLEFLARISKYSQAQYAVVDKDLEDIKYKEFVEELFDWSEINISKIKFEIKSPFHRVLEKLVFIIAPFMVGVYVLSTLGWNLYTKDWGLKGDFYQGMNFDKYLFSNYKKEINFAAPADMDPSISHDKFSTRWQGYLLVPHDGNYKFYLESDDGSRLWIDGKLLYDAWSGSGHQAETKVINLSKGPHRIMLDYYQDWGEAYLRLSWSINGGKRQIIPASHLRHE